jgi:putative tryptophan/tyrosine transport system substrate-binding protein
MSPVLAQTGCPRRRIRALNRRPLTDLISALLEATRSIPIVFAAVADAVGAGYVESLSRPGGNATGFTVYEYSFGGKWLELLKEIAPSVTHAAVLRDSSVGAGPGQYAVLQALAPSFGLELRPVDIQDASDLERSITAFAQRSNVGLIVTGSPAAVAHRDLIIALAARHRLPAIYYTRLFGIAGGLRGVPTPPLPSRPGVVPAIFLGRTLRLS